MKFYNVVFSVDGSIKRWERFVFAENKEEAKNIIKKYYSNYYKFTFFGIEEIEIKKGVISELIGYYKNF